MLKVLRETYSSSSFFWKGYALDAKIKQRKPFSGQKGDKLRIYKRGYKVPALLPKATLHSSRT